MKLRNSLPALLASRLYGTVIRARNWTFDRGLVAVYRSSIPVVSVGNVLVGGSGKSPFTAFLARLLLEQGRRPVILLRGYRGSLSGPHIVAADDDPMFVGDEALMHRLELPPEVAVVIARRRAAGARLCEERSLGDVLLLDDGFQHRRLAREIDLVLFPLAKAGPTAQRASSLLPQGDLREPLGALRRATALVYVEKSTAAQGAVPPAVQGAPLPSEPPFHFALRPACFRDILTGQELALEEWRGRDASALTAIAEPLGFFRLLENLGIKLRSRVAFRDHHPFSAADLARVADSGEPVLVTVKDAVKLRRYVTRPATVYALALEGELRGAGERERLLALMTRTIGGKEQRRSAGTA